MRRERRRWIRRTLPDADHQPPGWGRSTDAVRAESVLDMWAVGAGVGDGGGAAVGTVDFDLHGLAGVRLLDASGQDAAVVERQLGPIRASLSREPDVLIRFVDRLPASAPVRYIGVDDAGFTHEDFLIMRGKHKSRVRVKLPFDRIGDRCEIVCERGLTAVPLLIPVVNLTVLGNGALAVHASAFVHDGVAVMATGWSKGGKTEALLAFAANGAAYVGDEWVYLTADGQRMFGIPEPIRLWDWQLRELPQYRRVAARRERVRLRSLAVLAASLDRAAGNGDRHWPWGTTLRRLAPLVQRQLSVQIPPGRLFGDEVNGCAEGPHKVFFVASRDAPAISVRPIDPVDVARRMAFSLQEERADFMSYYRKFRFAFPEASNDLIERAAEIEQQRLSQALAGREAFVVHHPYPLRIASLYEAIRPVL